NHATVPADLRYRTGKPRRLRNQWLPLARRHERVPLAIRHTPRPAVVRRAGRVSARAMARWAREPTAAIRIFPIRWWSAALHRAAICHAREHADIEHDRATVAAPAGVGRASRVGASAYVAAETRHTVSTRAPLNIAFSCVRCS